MSCGLLLYQAHFCKVYFLKIFVSEFSGLHFMKAVAIAVSLNNSPNNKIKVTHHVLWGETHNY